jgi:hypothetical protein
MKTQFDTVSDQLSHLSDPSWGGKHPKLHEYVINKSIDFLQMCRVDLAISPNKLEVSKHGICFLFLPNIIIGFNNNGSGYLSSPDDEVIGTVVPEIEYEYAVEWLRNRINEPEVSCGK